MEPRTFSAATGARADSCLPRAHSILAAACLAIALGAPALAQECPGDCNGDGEVTIAELLTTVNIALGSLPVTACPASDPNGDGTVAVNEIVQAVTAALSGCGPTPTVSASDATASPTTAEAATPTEPPSPPPTGEATPTATASAEVTASATTATLTASATPTATDALATATPTATGTPTATATATPTATGTPTASTAATDSPSATATVTPTASTTPTDTPTPTPTKTSPPQTAPPDANFNDQLTIPLDSTASVTDFVSYPNGDVQDRVRWDISGMNPNPVLSGGRARLVLSVSCFGTGTDNLEFFTGGQTFTCGHAVVDREVTFDSKTGTLTITAVAGEATYVQWVLTGTATRVN